MSHHLESTVSDRPGETREIIFYGMGSVPVPLPSGGGAQTRHRPALVIVDMPGYGFAFMSEDDVARCGKLSRDYLRLRGNTLKRVLLLLDARHGLKAADREFFKGLADDCLAALSETGQKRRHKLVQWTMQIVLTKCDMVERSELARRMQLLRQDIDALLPGFEATIAIIPVSGKHKKGIIELQKELAALVPPKASGESPKV